MWVRREGAPLREATGKAGSWPQKKVRGEHGGGGPGLAPRADPAWVSRACVPGWVLPYASLGACCADVRGPSNPRGLES